VQWIKTAPLPLHPLVLLEISGLPSTIRTCDLGLEELVTIQNINEFNGLSQKYSALILNRI
jgi:hypothetical protein